MDESETQDFTGSLSSCPLTQRCYSCLKHGECGSKSSGEFYTLFFLSSFLFLPYLFPSLPPSISPFFPPSLIFYLLSTSTSFFYTRIFWENLQTIQAQNQVKLSFPRNCHSIVWTECEALIGNLFLRNLQ